MSGTTPYAIGMVTMLGVAFMASDFQIPDLNLANMLKTEVDANHMYCERDPALGPVVRDAKNEEVVYALYPESRAHARIKDGFEMNITSDGNGCEVLMLDDVGARIFEMK